MKEQERNIKAWCDLQEVLNRGEFDKMDAYFHTDFVYDNRTRPDLNTYSEWKKSPIANYTTLRYNYTVKKITADGDEVWAYCNAKGKHSGGPYMGMQPTGKTVDIDWVSIVEFKDGKIIRITSVADVLLQLIQLGVIDRSAIPIQPNR